MIAAAIFAILIGVFISVMAESARSKVLACISSAPAEKNIGSLDRALTGLTTIGGMLVSVGLLMLFMGAAGCNLQAVNKAVGILSIILGIVLITLSSIVWYYCKEAKNACLALIITGGLLLGGALYLMFGTKATVADKLRQVAPVKLVQAYDNSGKIAKGVRNAYTNREEILKAAQDIIDRDN